MEDIIKISLIKATLSKYQDVNIEHWFSSFENYKTDVVREIYAVNNDPNQREQPTEKEGNFIRAVVDFI
ncbi:MAG: hypothetical protein QMD36_05860 [Candidatus Aenigmarchaeota archaeon]|nr:hypothetical protein [Candidatus Aenigmarchaeota archaeon]